MSNLIFHYKVLGSPIKLTHAEMNQNLRSIEEAVDIVQNAELVSSDASDLAVNAAAVATQAKEDAVTAKGQAELVKEAAESAKEDAIIAKNAAEQANTGAQAAKDTAVSANTTAQSAKTAAELARNDSVAARNIAQTSATTATNAKNAAETARNTATQKANEANQSAIDAEYWAGLSEESAGEVISVQGKKGKVDSKRGDFSWMGDAAEKTVVFNRTEGTAGRLVDTLWRGLGGPINLDGTLPISEQITSNGLFLHSKGSNPYPPDSPDPSAINLLTLGAVGWHSQFAFSAYSNRVYTRCRVASNGAYRDWAEFYTTLNLKQATQAELNAGTQTAPRIYAPKTFYDAAAFVAHNIANPLNLNAGNNFTISITANSTLTNPTGAKSGQTGTLYINHDESLTLSFGSAWKFIGDIPELPTGAGQAVITYQVIDASNILATFGVIK